MGQMRLPKDDSTVGLIEELTILVLFLTGSFADARAFFRGAMSAFPQPPNRGTPQSKQ
jgi:hypothetical protein